MTGLNEKLILKLLYLFLQMFESTGWSLEEPDVPETANFDVLTPTIVKPKKQSNINVDDFHVSSHT